MKGSRGTTGCQPHNTEEVPLVIAHLPGISVGPHDAFVVDPDDGRPLKERLLWVHHAERDVPHYNPQARAAGRLLRRRGEVCYGGRPLNHTATGDSVETLTLRASLLCADCGRHGFLTDGTFTSVCEETPPQL